MYDKSVQNFRTFTIDDGSPLHICTINHSLMGWPDNKYSLFVCLNSCFLPAFCPSQLRTFSWIEPDLLTLRLKCLACRWWDTNPQPLHHESCILPNELQCFSQFIEIIIRHSFFLPFFFFFFYGILQLLQ